MQTTSHDRYFDNPVFNLHDTAVVLFKTSFMNHEAAISLNEAYHLNLTRIDDLTIDDKQYPVYIFHSTASRLSFIMLAAPSGGMPDPCFSYYDKMLFIRGRDARQFQQKIYDDLSASRPEPPTGEMLKHSHWEMLNLLNQGIFEPATLNFQPNGTPVTSLYSGPEDKMPRKLRTQIKQLKEFFSTLYSAFEWHLTNPVELDEIARGLDGEWDE